MPYGTRCAMAPAAERAEAADRSNLRVNDDAATATLVGRGLGVARVTALAADLDQPGTPRTVVWHRNPTKPPRRAPPNCWPATR
jgi:DNA-binding transcriptional LysR family regulator